MNFAKFALTPLKTVEHLGFIWDSDKMLISLPQDKIKRIIARTNAVLNMDGMKAGD